MMKNKFVLFVVLFSIIVFSCGKKQDAQPGAPKAPSFKLKTFGGKQYTLSDFKGKGLLINFWATWCPPCVKEMPMFQELYEKYKDKGFVILGIAMDQNPMDAQIFVNRKGITYPIVAGNSEIMQEYGVRGLPTSFIVDKQGRIAQQFLGMPPEKQLEKQILEVLNQ